MRLNGLEASQDMQTFSEIIEQFKVQICLIINILCVKRVYLEILQTTVPFLYKVLNLTFLIFAYIFVAKGTR